jgi:hypothetical protein
VQIFALNPNDGGGKPALCSYSEWQWIGGWPNAGIAIFENYQREDGIDRNSESFAKPYMAGKTEIRKLRACLEVVV